MYLNQLILSYQYGKKIFRKSEEKAWNCPLIKTAHLCIGLTQQSIKKNSVLKLEDITKKHAGAQKMPQIISSDLPGLDIGI